ncbi:MAG: ATP-dependent DNA helicase [Polyangiaceae bacterium]|nr:ATP-dependent DNA helicase [Polyangiaceae bacterium]
MARSLLGPEGPLPKALPGYEDRAGQLAMADAVERALNEDRTLLCEAGTGTGKTLAYLVPAILSGRKVVVSTATKALEDQIFTKDLPLIVHHLRLDPQAALVKGLGNYLCLRRFNELRKSPAGALPSGSSRSLPLIERWAKETETGDVAELVTLAEGDPLWREIASSSDTRIGSSCQFFDACFVTRMKRDMERARLLIVNHHLFFADLAVKAAAAKRGFGGAGVLPPYDAVIFDEAHQLEDIATEFFGTRISRARVEAMLRDADRAFVASALVDPVLGAGEATGLSRSVLSAAEAFFERVARLAGGIDGRVLLAGDVWSGDLLDAYHGFDTALEALEDFAKANTKSEAVDLVGKRAGILREDAARIVDPAANQVKWAEARSRSVSLGASPVDVGGMFREEVFERIGACVLTSATLTVGGSSSATPEGGGSFRFLRSRMGLTEEVSVPVDELSVPSPFDFPNAAVLYTPRDLPETTDYAFVPQAADRIAELVSITGGGAFVLCTSLRGMSALADALRTRLDVPPLVQGSAPKTALLSRFRAHKDAVLVATMSFWEGVDVPGEALRLVIIEKIPFAVPTDPIVAARCAAIEREGGNPFVAYSVPQAAITLKQGFGRLIRTRSDRGIVAILDKRIKTRGYGRVLLSSLPPARRTEKIDEVRAFWDAIGGRGSRGPLPAPPEVDDAPRRQRSLFED